MRKNSNERFNENGDRLNDFGNELGQGINTQVLYGDFTASYQLKHNFFIDLKAVVRRLESEMDERDLNSLVGTVALRWNIPQRELEF